MHRQYALIACFFAATGCGDDVLRLAPTGLEAVALSPTSIEVRWQPVQSDESYQVFYSTDSTVLDRNSVNAGFDTSITITGLTPVTEYFVAIRSFQPILGPSALSEVVSVTTSAGPLRAPFGLTPVTINPNSIEVAWQSDDATTEGFFIETRRPPDPFERTATAAGTERSTVIRNLQLTTRYQVRVQAFRGATTSAFTNTATVTTTSPPGTGITAVYPPSGSTAGGYPVAIRGWGFTSAPPDVFFGARRASRVVVVDDTHLSCIAPASPPGRVDVGATNPDGEGLAEGAFTFSGPADTALSIELQGLPNIFFNSTTGVTTVGVPFVVRDSERQPVRGLELRTRMFVDGEELGVSNRFNEGLLDERSQELEQNLYLFLTLDASYSLVTQFLPEQFTPMLRQASSLVQRGIDIWGTAVDDPLREDDKFGQFFWDVAWFRELIEVVATSSITPAQIEAIPAPRVGNETKMRSAVSFQVDASTQQFERGRAIGPLDRHVVVVFTDGQDTLSWFGNAGVMQTSMLNDGTPTIRQGWRATELDDLLREIVRHPLYPEQFSVFTVGLGQGVDQTPLRDIAQVGLGEFFFDPSNIANVFDRLSAEITEQLTRGATLAIRPGEYQFRLVVDRVTTGESVELNFLFRAGNAAAGLIEVQ